MTTTFDFPNAPFPAVFQPPIETVPLDFVKAYIYDWDDFYQAVVQAIDRDQKEMQELLVSILEVA